MSRATSAAYVQYWGSRIDQITQLVQQAYEYESSDPLDVRDLRDVGMRADSNWRGRIELSSVGIVKSSRTYLRHLGRALIESGSLEPYGGDAQINALLQGIDGNRREHDAYAWQEEWDKLFGTEQRINQTAFRQA